MKELQVKNLVVSAEESFDHLGNKVYYVYIDIENPSDEQERFLQQELGQVLHSGFCSDGTERASVRIELPFN